MSKILDELSHKVGGRGQCPKCGEVVNNVAYHSAWDCKPPIQNTTPQTKRSGHYGMDIAYDLGANSEAELDEANQDLDVRIHKALKGWCKKFKKKIVIQNVTIDDGFMEW